MDLSAHTRTHKKLTDFKSVSAVSFQYTLEPSSWVRIHTQVVALFRLSFFFFFVCSFVARFLLNLALLFRRQFAFLAFNANLIVQRNTVANCIKRRSLTVTFANAFYAMYDVLPSCCCYCYCSQIGASHWWLNVYICTYFPFRLLLCFFLFNSLSKTVNL